MAQSTVLIISGLPCSGKSNLAARLQDELRWPLLAKDAIKENLFETLGWRDRAWSRRLSQASYALMFATAEPLLACGINCILEGNFRGNEHDARLLKLLNAGAARCLQILCKAPPAVLLERYIARAQGGLRHPGHVDLECLPELKAELAQGRAEPLQLPGAILELDTGLLDESKYGAFIAEVLKLIDADRSSSIR